MEQIDAMAEANPMLGLRGCRLGIVYPILPVMQVRAIATAAAQLKKEGLDPQARDHDPAGVRGARARRSCAASPSETIAEVAAEQGVELDIPIGTMIELPRAAVTADEIATKADFFSFGTNDLTQTTFGFSRDDVEAEFIPQYLARAACCRYNPFATVDPGVAKLVKMGVELGHEGNPDLVCGVCGEHGGDPDSVKTFHAIGLDYVSLQPLPRAVGSPGCRSGRYRRQAVMLLTTLQEAQRRSPSGGRLFCVFRRFAFGSQARRETS